MRWALNLWLGLSGLLFGFVGICHAEAQETIQSVRVAYVGDGDTLWVESWLPGTQARQGVRIMGIDAPEICQEYGVAARDALRDKIQGQRVHLILSPTLEGQKDAYGRWLARVEGPLGAKAGEPLDVGRWMVAKGHAWSSANTLRGKTFHPYRAEQSSARSAGQGLWQSHHRATALSQGTPAIPPWRFRRLHGSCYENKP